MGAIMQSSADTASLRMGSLSASTRGFPDSPCNFASNTYSRKQFRKEKLRLGTIRDWITVTSPRSNRFVLYKVLRIPIGMYPGRIAESCGTTLPRKRRDHPAVGHGHRRAPADARGAWRLGQRSGVLAGRQDVSVGFRRRDHPAELHQRLPSTATPASDVRLKSSSPR